MAQPIISEITVEALPAEAFARFVGDMGRWWPMAYSRGGARFVTVHVEPVAGGTWFEVDSDGAESPWGDVRAYDPGHRLVVGFNVASDRGVEPLERQSEVEFRFEPAGEGTRVTVEHRNLDRHGDGAEAIRQGMASDHGWPLILASFARELRFPRAAPLSAS
ncbi:SRPBCC family protein [Caulobacter endophyticus]|nr:SRPBCC family protein [Caulobacter endophyticus]